MDSMITLGSLYDRALDMAKNYRDELAPARDVCFFDLGVVNVRGSLYEMRTAAQQSICGRLNIPYSFLRRCPPELQSSNLNYFLRQDESREFFVRCDGGDARVFLSPRFKPVDHTEILDRLISLGYSKDLKVQGHLSDELMFLNVPDEKKRFSINGDRMMPGISISNSQLGMASLSISVFVLRLVCTNGMISKTAVSSSYRHTSTKILEEFPAVLESTSHQLQNQKDMLRLSFKNRVENPAQTIENFNRQFGLSKEEQEAVKWAIPLEGSGDTMFHVINVYTRAAQHVGLSPVSHYKLQQVGGMILGMVI